MYVCVCVLVLILTFSLFYFSAFAESHTELDSKNDLPLPIERDLAWRMISPRVCVEWSNGGGGVENGAQLRHSTFFSVQNCFLSFFSLNLWIISLLTTLSAPRETTLHFLHSLGPGIRWSDKGPVTWREHRRSQSHDAHCNCVHTWIGKSAPSPALEAYPCRGARRGMYTLSLLDPTHHHHNHLHHSHRRHTPLSIYVKRCTIPIIPGRLFFGVITMHQANQHLIESSDTSCESVTMLRLGWACANYLIDLSHIFVALFWLNPNQPTHTPPNSAVLTILCIFSPFFNVDYLKCEKGMNVENIKI